MLQWRAAKLLGGSYLIYVALKHLLFSKPDEPSDENDTAVSHASFWYTVAAIELTDIAFAIDSILAAIALVGNPPHGDQSQIHPKLWGQEKGTLII